jgi:hypothetical protein
MKTAFPFWLAWFLAVTTMSLAALAGAVWVVLALLRHFGVI